VELWLSTFQNVHARLRKWLRRKRLPWQTYTLGTQYASLARGVVFPQPQSRVQTRTCGRKEQKDKTPNAKSTWGRTLAQRTRCNRQVFAICACIALCTVQPLLWSRGNPGCRHRTKNAATQGAFTRFACHILRNQGWGGITKSLRKKPTSSTTV
jgi:hypothetical protein